MRAGPAQELRAQLARQPAGPAEDHRQVVDHAPEQHRPPALEVRAGVQVGEDAVVLVEDVEVAAAGGAEDAAPAPLPVVDADPVERRDRPGRHQHRVRPGRVLVVAGREGEPLPFDEVPAVGLVPDHHQHLQQARPVGEAEGRGSLLGQPRRLLVAHGLARPERARVVVHQDVRVAGLPQPVGDRPQRVRGEGVVAVEEDQVVAGGPLHPGVAGPAEPHVLRQPHRPYAGVAGRVLLDDRAAGVRRAVVDRDQLQVGVGLREDRFQAGGQVRLYRVRGDDDTEPGQGTSMGRRGRTALKRPMGRSGYAGCCIRGNPGGRAGAAR